MIIAFLLGCIVGAAAVIVWAVSMADKDRK